MEARDVTSLGRLHFCKDPQLTSKLTFLTSLLLKFYILLFIGFLSKFPHLRNEINALSSSSLLHGQNLYHCMVSISTKT